MTKNIEKYIVLFYNELSGDNASSVLDIPEHCLSMLQAYSYEEIIRPFVIKDLQAGMSRDQIQIKYGVNNHFGRILGRRIGRYKVRQKKQSVPSYRKAQ